MATAETYIRDSSEFQARETTGTPVWLRELRKASLERFAALGFPAPKDEKWRFTRIRPLLGHDFRLAERYEPSALSSRDIDDLCMEDIGCRRLAFVNGHFARDLSDLGELPAGVRIGSLKTFIETDPEPVQRHLSKFADTSRNPFVALNTAHVYDGTFLYLPRGARLEEPVHLLYVSRSNGDPVVSHPRTLIIAEDDSRASIVESFVGFENDTYFTNAVTEILVKQRAEIEHCKLQRESESAYHLSTVQAQVGRGSRFKTHSILMGGTLVRNEVNTILADEGVECAVNGLYLGRGHQHIDNHTVIEHAKPNCASRELFKGILDGRSKAVFDGRIHVRPNAQKTDAKQTSRCILLSDDAQINTNPQLEIYADDVKCTHGAAVGKIDEDAVFYLRTRGIERSMARQMLVFAFANEILEALKIGPVRERLSADLYQWLSAAARMGESVRP
jgi:Fe-S cluster assembly protein SufD